MRGVSVREMGELERSEVAEENLCDARRAAKDGSAAAESG